MRLTVITHESPYPPDHGGKLDIWNRLVALRDHGVAVQLVVWTSSDKQVEGLGALRRTVDDLVAMPRRVRRSILWRGKYPPRMLTYEAAGADREQLLSRVRSFVPDGVLLDAWPAYLSARLVAAELSRPLLYRSQNVEHVYLREQLRLASGLTRLKLWLNCFGIERIETEIRQRSAHVFDISREDAAYWTSKVGGMAPEVMPPLWRVGEELDVTARRSHSIDILFAGNLFAPNNVDGLVWFSQDVLPLVRSAVAAPLRVVFAGSRPSRRLENLCRAWGVECVADPKDMDPIVGAARVVVNPVSYSSGVNMKMLPLIGGGGHVVATHAAVRGLPDEVAGFCRVTSDAPQFAAFIVDALATDAPADIAARRGALHRHFGPQALRPLIEALSQ